MWIVAAVVVLGFLAFLAVGANEPEDPRLEPATATTGQTASDDAVAARVPVEGFGEIAFRLSGSTSGEFCALLAESTEQVQQGLMGRNDLSGYDAMVFRFAAETTGPFFMRNVPMALDIAWFDDAGEFVSSTTMDPCEDREGCPLYPPAGAYRFALEAEAGGLARLGIDDDTVLALGAACPPTPTAATAG